MDKFKERHAKIKLFEKVLTAALMIQKSAKGWVIQGQQRRACQCLGLFVPYGHAKVRRKQVYWFTWQHVYLLT